MNAPLVISDKFWRAVHFHSDVAIHLFFPHCTVSATFESLSDFTVISLPLCPGSTISTVFSGEVAAQQLLLVENVEINRERKVRPTKQ